ncbi:unnamed protein product [Rangifer tarandus platyrhynchus]|uniref:Uncharacterized protein n=2 Tax=Rangifer tarandus platyrhynchus TaxID=3082113 RepID=A0ACB0EJY4_RANTA|nr:unnamed protein product [Rangifer tarandus platyrhynchus]CAI9701027.1 unnamed protein product [Rangifer tarandus platyrhynchus]
MINEARAASGTRRRRRPRGARRAGRTARTPSQRPGKGEDAKDSGRRAQSKARTPLSALCAASMRAERSQAKERPQHQGLREDPLLATARPSLRIPGPSASVPTVPSPAPQTY